MTALVIALVIALVVLGLVLVALGYRAPDRPPIEEETEVNYRQGRDP